MITPEERTRAALLVLVHASEEALLAYRAIFGRSAWNQRDRTAFSRLVAAIDVAKDGTRVGERASLRRRLERRKVAP